MTKKHRPRQPFAAGESVRLSALDALAEARLALERPSRANAMRIHDFRKAMKRFRAMLRLSPPPFDEIARHIRVQARDLARDLGHSRDAQSALNAIHDLTKGKSPNGLSERSIKTIKDRLSTLKKSAERVQLTQQTKLELIAWIESTEDALRSWQIAGQDLPVVDRIAAAYRRARRDWPRKWSVATAEEIHEFRQRVIVHRFHLDLLTPLHPKMVHKWISGAQGLRARLGRHQDLELLLRMSAPGQPLAPWRLRLEKLVARRQQDHLMTADRSADLIFGASPKAFRKRVDAMIARKLPRKGTKASHKASNKKAKAQTTRTS